MSHVTWDMNESCLTGYDSESVTWDKMSGATWYMNESCHMGYE